MRDIAIIGKLSGSAYLVIKTSSIILFSFLYNSFFTFYPFLVCYNHPANRYSKSRINAHSFDVNINFFTSADIKIVASSLITPLAIRLFEFSKLPLASVLAININLVIQLTHQPSLNVFLLVLVISQTH